MNSKVRKSFATQKLLLIAHVVLSTSISIVTLLVSMEKRYAAGQQVRRCFGSRKISLGVLVRPVVYARCTTHQKHDMSGCDWMLFMRVSMPTATFTAERLRGF